MRSNKEGGANLIGNSRVEMIFGSNRKWDDYKNSSKSIIDTEMVILGITDWCVYYSQMLDIEALFRWQNMTSS